MENNGPILVTVEVSSLRHSAVDAAVRVVEAVVGERVISTSEADDADGRVLLKVEASMLAASVVGERDAEEYVARHVAYGVWRANAGWADVRLTFDRPLSKSRTVSIGRETYAQSAARLGLPDVE